jgi:3-phosphoglycerate kinase
MIKLKNINELELEGKKVFLRLDLDVPILNGEVEDDSRLRASLDTLDLLLKKLGNVIIAGHLGRPKGVEEKFTLAPIANWFAKHYATELVKGRIEQFDGWKIKEDLFILENLRFFEGEEKNSPEFSQKLASLADIYINDAFAVSHRAHASIVGVPGLLPHYPGIHLEKEIEALSRVLENPKRPLIVIIGGAKIETKSPMVRKMNSFADQLLVGGAIALELRNLLENDPNAIGEKKANILIANLTEDKKDIDLQSAESFAVAMKEGQTIIWNGLMGVVEEGLEAGTKRIVQGIIDSNAYSVVGGGDTVGYLQKIGLLDKFSFVSTGGGAMLEFLAGEKLPGIEALLT